MIGVHIEIPDHLHVLEKLAEADFTTEQLEQVVLDMCRIGENSIREAISDHVRTGVTLASIESWLVQHDPNIVSYATGSRSRANQLYWLDQGRKEVRPVRARRLRWIDPNGIVVFSMYSRPTVALNFMRRAGLDALSQASAIIENVKGGK